MASDAAANTSECIQTITVVDTSYVDFVLCQDGPGSGIRVDYDCFDFNLNRDVTVRDFGNYHLGFKGN